MKLEVGAMLGALFEAEVMSDDNVIEAFFELVTISLEV